MASGIVGEKSGGKHRIALVVSYPKKQQTAESCFWEVPPLLTDFFSFVGDELSKQ
jgi:hypothetical protein